MRHTSGGQNYDGKLFARFNKGLYQSIIEKKNWAHSFENVIDDYFKTVMTLKNLVQKYWIIIWMSNSCCIMSRHQAPSLLHPNCCEPVGGVSEGLLSVFVGRG